MCTDVRPNFQWWLYVQNYNVYTTEGLLLFLLQVQDVTMEIQDLLQWLDNTDLRLSSSKTMWGMPDSASERLNAHLVKQTRLLTIKIMDAHESKILSTNCLSSSSAKGLVQ